MIFMGLIKKIGLGTVQFGTDYGISNKRGQTKKEEVYRILETAKNNSVSIIDTASAYGNAESVIGEFDLTGFRVISKFLPLNDNDDLEKTFHKSLKNLNVVKLYGYLAHRPLSLLNSTYWHDLKNLKENGLVEKIGFSLNEPSELDLLLDKNIVPDLIQVPFNYFDHRFIASMKLLKQRGCEIHTRSTFLQGLFFMIPEKLGSFFDEVKPQLKKLQSEHKAIDKFLLNFVLHKEYIDQVIVGVENREQLINNFNNVGEFDNSLKLTHTVSDKILMPSNWPKN